jgi:hypothetical protein
MTSDVFFLKYLVTKIWKEESLFCDFEAKSEHFQHLKHSLYIYILNFFNLFILLHKDMHLISNYKLNY